MLTALWLSVGIVYLVGAFNSRVILGASLLAIFNSIDYPANQIFQTGHMEAVSFPLQKLMMNYQLYVT